MQPESKAPRRGVHHIVYYCMALGFTTGMAMINLPPALDVLMEHYQVSYLSISVLITALLWPHTFIMLPGGVLVDRISLKLAAAIGLFLLMSGNLVAVFIPSLNAAMAGRVVCGLGTGILFISSMKLMALHASEGRAGTYQALFGGCVALGSILTFLVVPVLAGIHWSWAYGLPALTAGICILPYPFLKPKPRQAALSGFTPMVVAARTREAWLMGLAHSLSWGTVIGLGNWMPALFAESMGQADSIQYAWVGALMMVMSCLGRFTGGALILRVKPETVVWLSMSLIGLCYAALSFLHSPIAVMAAGLLTLWFASANFGAIFQVISYAVKPSAIGSLVGLVNFVANLGTIFITMICGWYKEDTGSFSGAFIYIAALGLLAGWLNKLFLPAKQNRG